MNDAFFVENGEVCIYKDEMEICLRTGNKYLGKKLKCSAHILVPKFSKRKLISLKEILQKVKPGTQALALT